MVCNILKIIIILFACTCMSSAMAETPRFYLDSPSWCHGVALKEIGKTVTLHYCYEHEPPNCAPVNKCDPDFGTQYRDQFTFDHQPNGTVLVKIAVDHGPFLPEIRCCSSKESIVSVMTVRPSISRAYDTTLNSPDEMCSGFFGQNWHQCESDAT